MYGLFQIFVRFALRGLVSEKNATFFLFYFFHKKSKIFIFLTFYMYGLSQIFVRFALRGLVSEKNVKFSFFDILHVFPRKMQIFIFIFFSQKK